MQNLSATLGDSDFTGSGLVDWGGAVPEVQFHSHDRIKLTLVFLLGIAIASLIEWASPQHTHTLGAATGLA